MPEEISSRICLVLRIVFIEYDWKEIDYYNILLDLQIGKGTQNLKYNIISYVCSDDVGLIRNILHSLDAR